MLATDEDALICDFAETYHILDYLALDPSLAATLAAGLAPESRIMRKLSGAKLGTKTLLLAACADSLSFLAWAQTEDGAKNRNRPKSILQALTGAAEEKPSEIRRFATGMDFDAEWRRIAKEVKENVD